MGDLDCRKCLDVNRRVPFLEPPDQIGVIAEPELGMEAAHDVELPGGHTSRLLSLLKDFFQ